MKKQILSEEFRRMQQLAGIITENDMLEKPQSITVELTDEFIREKNLYKFNKQIQMSSDSLYNLGNTLYKPFQDVEIYFAQYIPKIEEIHINHYVVPGKQVGKTDWFSKLMEDHFLSSFQRKTIQSFVEKGELKNIPDAYCIFRNGEYSNTTGLVIGAEDHRGYFKIVAVE